VLFVIWGVTACAHSPQTPRYHPEAPEIAEPRVTIEGDGFRFQVGVDGDCVVFRAESSGLSPRGGVICPYTSPRFDTTRPYPEQVRVNTFTSTADLMVVTYDGCVHAPPAAALRRVSDSNTTTTICEARIPAVVFGRLTGDVAYGCLVSKASGARFVGPVEDGIFLEIDPDTGTEGNVFAIAFSSTGVMIGDPPVDAPFADGLRDCQATGPWKE